MHSLEQKADLLLKQNMLEIVEKNEKKFKISESYIESISML